MESFSYFEDATFLTAPTSAFLVSFSYLAGVYLCTKIFSFDSGSEAPAKRSIQWDLALGVHNAILCVFSVVMLAGLLKSLFPILMADGLYEAFCDPNERFHRTALYFWLYVFYLSKIYEFLDTAFLLVRGRRPKFLHVYHHFLTFLICYVGNETKTTYAWVAMMNNTLVHSLMYFYYAYNSFTGVKLWWCKYLTTLQMTQFVVNGMGMFLWMYMDYQSPVGCSGNYGGVAVCMFGMVTYFVLFLGMFGQKYGKKTSVGKSASETDAQTKQTEG